MLLRHYLEESGSKAALACQLGNSTGVSRPAPAGPYRARTKGKVERPLRYLRGNFVYGRTFLNDADLDDQRQGWLERVEEFVVPARWRRFMEPIADIEKLLKGLVTLEPLDG